MYSKLYDYIIEAADKKRVERILTIEATQPDEFFYQVRKLAKGCSDHGQKRYLILAEARFKELQGVEEGEEAPEAIKRPEGDEDPNRKYHYLVCNRDNIPLRAQMYMTLAEAKARQKREVEECHKLGIPADYNDFPITDALKWLQFAK